jgi:flavin reductase (DIM6/NTAB) family NADH-FMN oxidoreductase RutF
MQDKIKLFKDCMSSFATGVTVVTTSTNNNNPQGITINSFSSLSLNPLLVSFNLLKSSNFFSCLSENKAFNVNILSEQQMILSKIFASPNSVVWDNIKFDYSKKTNSPCLLDSLGIIECNLYNIYEGGDHYIIIGEVIDLHKFESKPLVYYQRSYRKIGESIK